jgi:hypothetical protein
LTILEGWISSYIRAKRVSGSNTLTTPAPSATLDITPERNRLAEDIIEASDFLKN